MNTAKYGVGADFGFRPTTEQEQAEAYVRKQRPALMELTFGCEVEAVDLHLLQSPNPKEDVRLSDCIWDTEEEYEYIIGENDVVSCSNDKTEACIHTMQPLEAHVVTKIIGHPINLQDWMAVLEDIGARIDYYPTQRSLPTDKDFVTWDLRYTSVSGIKVMFNQTTGQPATKADFKAFNEIVSV